MKTGSNSKRYTNGVGGGFLLHRIHSKLCETWGYTWQKLRNVGLETTIYIRLNNHGSGMAPWMTTL